MHPYKNRASVCSGCEAMNAAHAQDNSVRLEIDDENVAWISLNRPQKHNAFDDLMIEQLHRYFVELGHNNAIRALVLRSEGPSFCAGADLAWMRRMAGYTEEQNQKDAMALAQMLRALSELPMPTIAQVQGNAFGGGVGLISGCDIAVAADISLFGLTEVNLGLVPATIGPYVLDAIGKRWASRLFITGERFDAERASAIGLVHEVCESEALRERVADLLKLILTGGPVAVRAAKTLARRFADRPVDDVVLNETSALIAAIRVSEEGKEGLSAFMEKRKPAWRSRRRSGGDG